MDETTRISPPSSAEKSTEFPSLSATQQESVGKGGGQGDVQDDPNQETDLPEVSESSEKVKAGDCSRDDASLAQGPKGLETPNLENELTNEKLTRLQQVFADADEDGGGGLDMEEFRHAMRHTMGDHVTDKELDMIFMKVDTNCDGTVDWDEYLTYMLLECREKDTMNVIAAQPFPKRMHQVKGTHRDSIVGLMFLPFFATAGHSRTKEEQERFERTHGRYISVSKDGIANFWNLEMKLLGSFRIEDESPLKKTQGPQSVWVTDIAYLSQSNFLAVSTTRRDIMFYDLNGNRFEKMSRVSGLEGCVMTMTFNHVKEPISNGMNDILLWGDSVGGISAIVFKKDPQFTCINPKLKKSSRIRIAFQEILTNKIPHLCAYYLPKVHKDLVRQVKFSQSLGCVISCCKHAETALFVGDLEQKLPNTYYKIPKGINSFDYCPRTNVIITGGYDTVIRVWNPNFPTKPVILLRGHNSPILFIILNHVKEYVISIAENKEVRIYDLNNQTCIQTFYRKMVVGLGLRPITAAVLNNARQALILATTTMAYLESREDEGRGPALTTHAQSVSVALYNPIFQQVVSAGDDGLVCVWALNTGQKVIQFLAHWVRENGVTTPIGITTMVFGQSMRRLITAAQDGSVKIWNFNNGACLRELQQFDNREVRAIVCPKQRIVTTGWNKRITVYVDGMDDESCSWLLPQHFEDVDTLAFYPPHTLASGSANGNIFLWSLETGRVLGCLNSSVSPLPQTPSAYIQSGYFSPNKVQPANMNEHLGDDLFILRMYRMPKISKTEDKREEDAEQEVEEEPDSASSRRASFLDEVAAQRYSRKAVFNRRERQKRASVEKLLFLTTRESNESTAILIVGSSDGFVRAWSIHHDGGLLGQFCVTHNSEDSISAMTTDPKNEFLVTCDTSGYIKVWHIADYCIWPSKTKKRDASFTARIYASFPFLNWRINMLRKSNGPPWMKRILSSGQCPTLLNSFRGHLQAINSVDYAEMEESQLIITASTDCSVRVWTLQGSFLGIFGQPDMWTKISDNGVPKQKPVSQPEKKPVLMIPQQQPSKADVMFQAQVGHLPPDVRRVASATTLSVLNSNRHPLWGLARHMVAWLSLYSKKDSHYQEEVKEEDVGGTLPRVESQHLSTYDQHYKPESSILGHSYQKLTRHRQLPTLPKLRQFNTQVAAYCSLPCIEMEEIKQPKLPQIIKEIKLRNQALSPPGSPTLRKCVRVSRKAGWLYGGKSRKRSTYIGSVSQQGSETAVGNQSKTPRKSLAQGGSQATSRATSRATY